MGLPEMLDRKLGLGEERDVPRSVGGGAFTGGVLARVLVGGGGWCKQTPNSMDFKAQRFSEPSVAAPMLSERAIDGAGERIARSNRFFVSERAIGAVCKQIARSNRFFMSERAIDAVCEQIARSDRSAGSRNAKLLVNSRETVRRPHPLARRTAPRPRLLNADRRPLNCRLTIDFRVQHFLSLIHI